MNHTPAKKLPNYWRTNKSIKKNLSDKMKYNVPNICLERVQKPLWNDSENNHLQKEKTWKDDDPSQKSLAHQNYSKRTLMAHLRGHKETERVYGKNWPKIAF